MRVSETAALRNEVTPYFSNPIKQCLMGLEEKIYIKLEEIHMRVGQPLLIKVGEEDLFLDSRGTCCKNLLQAYIVNKDDVYRAIASLSDNSFYAFEEEIRRGFITIPGGHRVGLAGQVVVQGNDIKTMKDFSGLCFRVAREKKDCARSIIPHICSTSGAVMNTLIISPPRCGKTTILRDLTRIISSGSSEIAPRNVVVVDERSEIAGSYRGMAQLDLGPRTNVLDACPKALGMMMAVRSLSPQLIITDEIGRSEDVTALQECVNAGVAVISSIHAGSLDELLKRPLIHDLLALGAFQLGIILSRRKGPGTVEQVIRWD